MLATFEIEIRACKPHPNFLFYFAFQIQIYLFIYFKKWKSIEHQLSMANSEALENVRFLNSLERFHFPFYGKIDDIKNHVVPLIGALRTVYNTSAFYNTSNSMAVFLSKCTNHLTLCCRIFIANGSAANVFMQPSQHLLQKISISLELLRSYQRAYEQTVKQMQSNGETKWIFSEMYVFGQANQLIARLSKVFSLKQ